MVEGLIRKWKGYVEIELLGYSPERFLNLCTARGIELWKVRCSSAGGYCCCISLRDFWRLKPILKKSGVRLRLSSRRGLPFFLHKNSTFFISAPSFFRSDSILSYPRFICPIFDIVVYPSATRPASTKPAPPLRSVAVTSAP